MAIAERTALVIESPDDPRLSDYERELYRESGTQSEICVPLVLEDRVVGLLDVYDHRRRDYAEHRDFLLRVGQMMAGAFENALLMERLEESNQTLALLVESGIEFGATLEQGRRPRERRPATLRRHRRAELRHLHAARRRRPLRGLHRPRRSGRGLRGHGVPGRPARPGRASRSSPGSPCTAEDIADDARVSEFERREDLSWGHRAMLVSAAHQPRAR